MPDNGPLAEPFFEPAEPVRGQRNFGQQHNHLFVGPQGRGDGLEIHLRLARPGHAVQQRDRISGADRSDERRRGGILGIRQDRARQVRIGPGHGFFIAESERLQNAGIGHATDDGGGRPGRPRKIGARHGPAVMQRRQHPPAGVRQTDAAGK